MNSQPSQRYAPWLWLLLGLFVLRVVSQPLALLVDTPCARDSSRGTARSRHRRSKRGGSIQPLITES